MLLILVLMILKKNILDEKYIGKMRRNNLFALNNFKQGNSNMYDWESRLADDTISYYIINEKIIQNIQLVLKINQLITKLEQEAYNDIESILKWIQEQKNVFENQIIHFVLRTIHD
jgi:hypothetical protein